MEWDQCVLSQLSTEAQEIIIFGKPRQEAGNCFVWACTLSLTQIVTITVAHSDRPAVSMATELYCCYYGLRSQ